MFRWVFAKIQRQHRMWRCVRYAHMIRHRCMLACMCVWCVICSRLCGGIPGPRGPFRSMNLNLFFLFFARCSPLRWVLVQCISADLPFTHTHTHTHSNSHMCHTQHKHNTRQANVALHTIMRPTARTKCRMQRDHLPGPARHTAAQHCLVYKYKKFYSINLVYYCLKSDKEPFRWHPKQSISTNTQQTLCARSP